MQASVDTKSSPFKQPGAVWAVAFACVISFMGIGLVDPILPALSSQLHATPSQVSLLFTSYLVVTAVMMLIVGWVSSRIGAKLTLIVGLAIIVVFAGLAGTSGSIGGIVGFRAGWGVGNALFIATSLAVIVASASGGFSGAIILYETALGLGIAVGPLLGGTLGSISWRGPFFGVSVLMALALVATIIFVPALPKPKQKISLIAPLAALRHRGLLTMGIMALLYNWGFFTMLGYAPYPMKLSAHNLGLVFTGWGILVAVFSVFVAPRLQRRFGTAPVLYANMVGLAIIMAVIALGVNSPATVIVAVIISGAFIGNNNTLTTQAVMLVAPVERSVASSAYGFVRFIGGGLAPWVAGQIADHSNQSVAFFVGALAFLLAIPVLASGHGLIRAAERQDEAVGEGVGAAAAGSAAAASDPLEPGAGSTSLEPVGERRPFTSRPVLVAVDGTVDADAVIDEAAAIAARDGAPLELVHVRETEVVEELAVDAETPEQARAVVAAQLARLAARGIAAHGQVLHSVGDHAAAGRALAKHADAIDARTLVVGRSARGPLATLAEGRASAELARDSTREVLFVGTAADAPEAQA